MLSFKSFLLEYLTDTQEKKYSQIKMTPKARSATDHFFGKNNDHVREELNNYDHDKSETHKAVERHIGTPLTHEQYKSGTGTDKHNRTVKLSKLIKDPKLQNAFSQDNTRASKGQQHHITVVRGHHVAGQTNPEPDALHPNGHSWAQQSCKNVKDGSNKKYLSHEIKHGTVVVRAHDSNGREIYRGTLQPHHSSDKKSTVYALNSEYGVKHPAFTAHANDVAKRLSGEGNAKLHTIHHAVYNDLGGGSITHPNATHEHISKALGDESEDVRAAAVEHHNATHEHISKALGDKSPAVRMAAVRHPNATHEHICKALGDRSSHVRWTAVEHPNATHEDISKALGDESKWVRIAAAGRLNQK